ncbi:Protein-disulfide isomerase [Albimonas donghaensis]|uniref:Protein-disulfide isomerase n=2 Tax=Albimonas donghaensis TaxID=356660 RepID=A0A1H2SEH2_9RHOB|nr:Protein-disulfide isomerase [Albimonas donghaensis]
MTRAAPAPACAASAPACAASASNPRAPDGSARASLARHGLRARAPYTRAPHHGAQTHMTAIPQPAPLAARPLRAALRALLPALALAALPALIPAPSPAQTAAPLSAPSSAFSPEDRAALRAEIRSYLLDNPEVIMEAIQVLEDRRRIASESEGRDLVARNAAALFEDGYSHVAGNPDGDVTVVEFIDYNCGYCKKAHDDVRKLVETDPGLRYVVKEFPILGPSSVTAARAALAAREQDEGRRYMAFNDALMNHKGGLSDGDVWALAAEAGLDIARLKADSKDPDIQRAIEATYSLAKVLKIEGTPTFVIGDSIVRGYVPLDRLRETVAETRERKG